MGKHLIHIGYPKAGSSFLQAWFEKHPELCYKPGGVGGFHNVYEIARPSANTYKYYVTSFEGLSTPHKNAGGVRLDFGGAEPTEVGRLKEDQARVSAVLKNIYPDSRVLIVTRGFKHMIISAYSQSVRMGGRLHLKGMCQELAARLQDDVDHYYDYDYLIGLYAHAFGEDNVIVLPYELLRDDEYKFLCVLEDTLGLAHHEIKVGHVNPSLSPEELYWYPLISSFVSRTASHLGTAGFQSVYRWYIELTLTNRLRSVIKLLRVMRPDHKITEADFPLEMLNLCEGKAKRLRGNPLYEPYAEDYLLSNHESHESI